MTSESRDAQTEAILKLLEDDDPDVVLSLAEQLKRASDERLADLSGEWRRRFGNSTPPAILHAQRLRAMDQFLQMASWPADRVDLETGAFLISTWGEPDRSVSRAKLKLDAYAGHLTDSITRADLRERPIESARSLCRYLFEEIGFSGNEDNHMDPANSFLAAVVERRKGIPITLSLLTLLVAGRMSLPLLPIGSPRRFMLAVEDNGQTTYVDCYGGGLFLKDDQAKRLIGTLPDGVDPFPRVDNREIIARMLRNLQAVYAELNDASRLNELHQMLTALAV